ncbi:MAG: hypothetical protein D6B25_09995 [Desulfobulbaceae bacterium]|nr:MAG: hypothetical protein D6B25_09995 [Desulfobulbaceae bacterium]
MDHKIRTILLIGSLALLFSISHALCFATPGGHGGDKDDKEEKINETWIDVTIQGPGTPINSAVNGLGTGVVNTVEAIKSGVEVGSWDISDEEIARNKAKDQANVDKNMADLIKRLDAIREENERQGGGINPRMVEAITDIMLEAALVAGDEFSPQKLLAMAGFALVAEAMREPKRIPYKPSIK